MCHHRSNLEIDHYLAILHIIANTFSLMEKRWNIGI